MARSLKETYETKRVKLLQEKMKRIDEQVVLEQNTARLIIETIDDEDLKKVTAIIQKLSKLKGAGVKSLTAGIESAEAEINKYTAGGPLTAAWTKMKKLVGIDNPIVKVTTFADALERGFSQIPTILKNNGINISDLKDAASQNQTLAQAITSQYSSKTGKANNPLGKMTPKQAATAGDQGPSVGPNGLFASQNEAAGDENNKNADQKLKSVIAQLTKALSPGGIFGAFKKLPYVDNVQLVKDLINAPLRVFSNITKDVNSGVKAAEIAPDFKQQITGAGETETKGSTKEEPTKATTQTDQSSPTKDSTSTTSTSPAGETTPSPQGGGAPQNYTAHGDKILNLFKAVQGKQNAGAILAKKLISAGLDPDKLKL